MSRTLINSRSVRMLVEKAMSAIFRDLVHALNSILVVLARLLQHTAFALCATPILPIGLTLTAISC